MHGDSTHTPRHLPDVATLSHTHTPTKKINKKKIKKNKKKFRIFAVR